MPEWAEAALSPETEKSDYYFFNTDRRSIKGPPPFHKLINGSFAATGGDRSYGEQLGRLAPRDTLLMYENRIGVVAIGTVQERWDGKSHSKSLYYASATAVGEGGYEYRIKVDWFLDLSDNPISIAELRERLGYTPPPRAVSRIVKSRGEVERMIEERLHDEARLFPEEIPADGDQIVEGAKKRVWVNAYERSEAARRECIEAWGYDCCVCSTSLEDAYGEYGAGYIHVHHLVPLSDIKAEYVVDPVEDLRPICPNCHAILHRRDPPYPIEDLRKAIQEKRGR